MSIRSSLLVVCIGFVSAACFGRNPDDANAQDIEDTTGTARRLAIVQIPAEEYRVVGRGDTGSIEGTLSFDGVPKGDTLFQIAPEQNGCNKPLAIKRLERKDGKVANVVVWLTDIREGRALPLKRRFELFNEDCMWDPMVQVIATGGTLNLFNDDALVEEVNIIEIASGDTANVALFTDPGQVIPYSTLFKQPKAYEFSVESRPMSRAWVIALDHPYAAITKTDGSFVIDGIPAGTYMLRAWHPMLGIADTKVQVKARETLTVAPSFP